MVEAKRKLSAYCWWFDSQSNSITRKSPWLQSTLAELDEKTGSMLKLIEEDADSFAKRAEMYYNKRPELINMFQDLYQAHRSLALRYDQTKFNSGNHLLTQYRTSQSQLMTDVDKSYDSYSESFDFEHAQDSSESEVDDPEHEEEEEEASSEAKKKEEITKLMEEIDRLKEENKIQKGELIQKDEEKREAIRQLSLCVDLLKQENLNLIKRIAKDSSKSSSPFTGIFWGKLFNGKATAPL